MTYGEYMDTILSFKKREKFHNLIEWVKKVFPTLSLVIKWNQPMFTDDGTFIISFSHAKNHISVSPEKLIMDKFIDRIDRDYSFTKMLFHIKWNQEVNDELLKDIIEESIKYKKDYDKFWL